MSVDAARNKGRRVCGEPLAPRHTLTPTAATLSERARVCLRELSHSGAAACELWDEFPRDAIAARDLIAIRFVHVVAGKYELTALGRDVAAALPAERVVTASAVYAPRRKRTRRAAA